MSEERTKSNMARPLCITSRSTWNTLKASLNVTKLSMGSQFTQNGFTLQLMPCPQYQKHKRGDNVSAETLVVMVSITFRYPDYLFMYDESIINSAAFSKRKTDEATRGTITDVYFLSQVDFIACTFSSQVHLLIYFLPLCFSYTLQICRMSYALMQSRHEDLSARFGSLDDIFYFGGQRSHDLIANQSYIAQTPKEISIKEGDVIKIAGNHWNGFSMGMNKRTGRKGLYPSYKVHESWKSASFPWLR